LEAPDRRIPPDPAEIAPTNPPRPVRPGSRSRTHRGASWSSI